jgi:hypothetical protein
VTLCTLLSLSEKQRIGVRHVYCLNNVSSVACSSVQSSSLGGIMLLLQAMRYGRLRYPCCFVWVLFPYGEFWYFSIHSIRLLEFLLSIDTMRCDAIRFAHLNRTQTGGFSFYFHFSLLTRLLHCFNVPIPGMFVTVDVVTISYHTSLAMLPCRREQRL